MNFPEIKIKPSQLHKVRGYFSRQFSHYDLIHNHKNGKDKFHYRYPAIQFKIHNHLAIHAYKQEGLDVLKKLFMDTESIQVESRKYYVRNKEIEAKDVQFGEDGQHYAYSFLTPWIALNQENFKDYQNLPGEKERNAKLNSILINNIIAFCKFAGYTLENRLIIRSKFIPTQTLFKGKLHLAFTGEFMVNFLLPDLTGLGKGPSRGYGNIIRRI